MKYTTTIAVDLAKSVFEVAVSDVPGHVSERHRFSRVRFLEFFAQHRPATVVFEACSSAHHWARSLGRLGHSVVLLPPHAVRPYIVRNKTDRADAKGILEAFRNKAILPVPVSRRTNTRLLRFIVFVLPTSAIELRASTPRVASCVNLAAPFHSALIGLFPPFTNSSVMTTTTYPMR